MDLSFCREVKKIFAEAALLLFWTSHGENASRIELSFTVRRNQRRFDVKLIVQIFMLRKGLPPTPASILPYGFKIFIYTNCKFHSNYKTNQINLCKLYYKYIYTIIFYFTFIIY